MDCATRWGSKLAMVERIFEQAQVIRHILSDDRRSSLSLTWQDMDMDVLKAVYEALKPVSDFTDILSGENYVTSSSILPILQLCRDNVLAASENDLQLTKSIKTGILTKLEAKYESDSSRKLMQKLFCIFLDPRYRGGYETDDNALAETKAELQAEIVSFEAAGPVAIRVEEGEVQPEPSQKKMTLGSMLQKKADALAGPVGVGTVEDRVGAEITAYCLEPVTQGDEDPLLWWKNAAWRFPQISRVARKYLCVCATSTPSERVFSTADAVNADKKGGIRVYLCWDSAKLAPLQSERLGDIAHGGNP
ncbi:E3 SUMO-protein ligase ZBED1-like [Pseudorasbora parva]|uniref:E3 SUMO-protein ligase ZBED1-like n=1 Tax=Pseudorasbora parva TaxID=51549 RepID=UPI00351DDC86